MKFNPTTMSFECVSSRTKEKYYIRHNIRKGLWSCTCWKFVNRPQARWGYCPHILKLFKEYEPTKYKKEKERSENAKRRY